MDLNISSELIGGGLISAAFAGWNLYLSSEKARLISDIKELKKWKEDYTKEQSILWLQASKDLYTKTEASSMEAKINEHLTRIENKLDKLILGQGNGA